MYHLMQSVADVWLVWLVSVFLLVWFSRRIFANFGLANCRRFHRSEHGASYALPYVLTFPIFLLVMAVFIQSTLILITKIGTVYSAHAACRAYIVWQPAAKDVEVLGVGFNFPQFKSKRAATMAMVPFASSNLEHRKSLYPLFPIVIGTGGDMLSSSASNMLTSVDRIAYQRTYFQILNDANENDEAVTSSIILNKKRSVTKGYIENKYSYAAAATQVDVPDDMVAWNEDVEVTVKYRMPFLIPGTGRVLRGKRKGGLGGLFNQILGRGRGPFFRDIETTIKMPSEAAKTDDGKIGIPYQPSMILEGLN